MAIFNQMGHGQENTSRQKKNTSRLSENCSLLGTDNVRGQISEHIFAAKLRLLCLLPIGFKNWGISMANEDYCLYIYIYIYTYIYIYIHTCNRVANAVKTVLNTLSSVELWISLFVISSYIHTYIFTKIIMWLPCHTQRDSETYSEVSL